ncbi:hypothetical protein F5Y15DRAFT_166175 [Xylariaceae sp. FL0016]|nr:hypothetical protein F5Y15DRAFT_166175 [Xylariaceae sp. FL0016]
MPPRKRTKVESPDEIAPVSEGAGRRRSGRISESGVKSKYFQDDVDDSTSASDDAPPARKRSIAGGRGARKKTKREMESEESEDAFITADEEAGDDDANEEDFESAEAATPPPAQTKKRGRGRRPKSEGVQKSQTPESAKAKTPGSGKRGRPRKVQAAAIRADGEDDESDENEDDRPQVEFIPLPKLRDTGGVDYEDWKLHKNTLLFLGDLRKNNQRSWLKMHDPEYRRSLKDWESFVTTLTDKISEADATIPELPLRDIIFRIYRDIRFSKDPTPYKPHYSVAWSRTGRKGPYACYYVHVEPGKCFVGGGLWHPEAAAIAKLRASVDERPHRIRRVLTEEDFRRTFLPGAKKNDEKSAIKAFAAKNKENALKTKPKGFHPDHRDIELLKLRNYTVGCKVDDHVLLGDDAQEKIMEIIRPMVGFVSCAWPPVFGRDVESNEAQVTFLNSVVMPDGDEDSSSEEEEEADGANGAEEDEDEEDGDDE